MHEAALAIRAAQEVQADTKSPNLFFKAKETFGKAKREYRFKNFREARQFADRAKRYAEEAEFESIQRNGKREADPTDPLSAPSP